MQPKLIIFDWNGTLADTTNPIITTFRRSFADCGLPVPEADRVRPLIGYSLPATVHHLIPDADGRMQAAVVETYASHYLNLNNHSMKLFDSTVPCLNTLKRQDYLLTIATDKGRTGLDRAVGQTGIAHFQATTTCTGEQPSKPVPEMVFILCDALGLMPSGTSVVGDMTCDLQMAANAKASAIVVAIGTHAKARLAAEPCLAVLGGLTGLPVLLVAL